MNRRQNQKFDMGDRCGKPCRYRDGYQRRAEPDWRAEYDNFAYFLDDKEAASRLKEKHLPPSLYRYRPMNDYVFHELENQYVYLNSAQNFNDPFETIGMLSRGEFDTLLKEAGEGYDQFKFRYNMLTIQKEMMESLEEDIGVEEPFVSRVLQKQCDLLQQMFYDTTEKQIDIVGSFITDRMRMTCFTDNHTSLPMWGHYADSHSGICIEYTFDEKRMASYFGLFPIRYENDLSKIHKCISKGLQQACFYILSRKDPSWKYENEWRYTEPYFGTDGSEGQHSEQFKVKAVYAGINCSHENTGRILEIGRRHQFDVYQMKKTHSGLEPELLN